MRGITFLSAVLLTSCYSPSYSGHYVCDPALHGSDCPDGWQCVNLQCLPPGADGSADLSSPTGGGDGGDGTDGAGTESPCTQGGMLLLSSPDRDLWACNGDFSFGQLGPLCQGAAGYHPCRADAMDSSLLSMISCAGINGFYIIERDASVTKHFKEYDAKCDPQPQDWPRALVGCGNDRDVVTLTGGGCASLHTALLCPPSGNWSCDAEFGLRSASHRNAQVAPGGVLCCKDPK